MVTEQPTQLRVSQRTIVDTHDYRRAWSKVRHFRPGWEHDPSWTLTHHPTDNPETAELAGLNTYSPLCPLCTQGHTHALTAGNHRDQ